MPGSSTGTFIDPDDYQASLHQARIDFLATSQGSFNAHLTWATLHRMQLLHSEEDLPRIAYVSLAPAFVFVGFTTRPDPPMFWSGVELQTGDIVFHGRGERFHPRTTKSAKEQREYVNFYAYLNTLADKHVMTVLDTLENPD